MGIRHAGPHGEISAAACGVPQAWIVDIGGAEAWALLQAAQWAFSGASDYRADSMQCINAFRGGRDKAMSAKDAFARVHSLLLSALEGTSVDDLMWIPARKKEEEDVGVTKRGDGNTLQIAQVAPACW